MWYVFSDGREPSLILEEYNIMRLESFRGLHSMNDYPMDGQQPRYFGCDSPYEEPTCMCPLTCAYLWAVKVLAIHFLAG